MYDLGYSKFHLLRKNLSVFVDLEKIILLTISYSITEFKIFKDNLLNKFSILFRPKSGKKMARCCPTAKKAKFLFTLHCGWLITYMICIRCGPKIFELNPDFFIFWLPSNSWLNWIASNTFPSPLWSGLQLATLDISTKMTAYL